MKLIESSVTKINQEPDINGIFKQIELAGRTCYKSEANITDTSAENFVERMINSKHTAMLEHGTLYLDIPIGQLGDDNEYMWKSSIIQIFKKNPYSRVNKYRKLHRIDDKTMTSIYHYAITTNYRVFIEQIPWEELGPMRYSKIEGYELGLNKDYILSFMCEPNEHHEKRITFKFITDRGVSHELVRHRVMSFAQESTRYCNYSKAKFGKELTFIIPTWFNNSSIYIQEKFVEICKECEKAYFDGLENGMKPEQIRQILPMAIKTEIVVTGFKSDWDYFLKLRHEGITGNPHPDIKKLANEMKILYI